MAARQCCPLTTGGRDRFDILTLSFFCSLQQTWQEKERGITAETGKFPPLLPPHPLFFHLTLFFFFSHFALHVHIQLTTPKCNSSICCHSQALNIKMTSFWSGYNSIQCLSVCSAQATCCQKEYSSILRKSSCTIAHIRHDSA